MNLLVLFKVGSELESIDMYSNSGLALCARHFMQPTSFNPINNPTDNLPEAIN